MGGTRRGQRYLRLVLSEPSSGRRVEPTNDPLALTFGLGWGTVADDVVAAIRKLGELRAAGLLTEGEFARKEAELLDRM